MLVERHIVDLTIIYSELKAHVFPSSFVCESAGVRSDNNKYNDNIDNIVTCVRVCLLLVCEYFITVYCNIYITKVKSVLSTYF